MSHSEFFLTTSRLGFRCWRESDLPLAVALWGDYEVTRFFSAAGAWSIDAVRQRLRAEMALDRVHGLQYWPIFELESGRHLGCCGLRPYEPAGRIYELGVHLLRDQWGRGFASEASRAVIDYAFERLGARALFAGHHPENEASRRLLATLGFRHTHDERYPPTGLLHPSYRLEEWGQLMVRPATTADVPQLVAFQLEGRSQQMAARSAAPADRDAESLRFHGHLANPTIRLRAIEWRGALVGYVTSFERDGVVEVGYWLGERYWGRGLATRALRAFLVEETRRPLTARVAVDNSASLRVLEKCGFVIVGSGRYHSAARGRDVDESILRLLD